MKKFTQFILYSILSMTFLFSCQEGFDVQAQLDRQLDQALEGIAGSQGRDLFKLPSSTQIADIPQDPRNLITPEKVALGKLLYHETGLSMAPMKPSSSGTYSCASCHQAAAGFQAGLPQGIGDGGSGFGLRGEQRTKSTDYLETEIDVQPIRSPSTLNVAYQKQMLWNGQFGATGRNIGTEDAWTKGTPIETNFLGYEGVETQAIAGLKVHRMVVDTNFLQEYGYIHLFDQAFPDLPRQERYTRITAGLAIAAYERTLLANQSPWQKWLHGDPMAMTEIEKRGAILFFGKAACAPCHNGPALNANKFFAYGMNDLDSCSEPVFAVPSNSSAHLGRGSFTGQQSDMHKFKVPQLYNLKDAPFMGHGSSFSSIRAVVQYKNKGVPENPRVPQEQITHMFTPLGLTSYEVDAITSFIEEALYDPNLSRYQPDQLPSGFCFPNNDTKSKTDLGCN